MTEAAAGEHADFDAAGGHPGREDERDLVAHAAGGVLVGDVVVLSAQVPLIAAPQHGLRQRGHLFGGHPVDGDGHQQRRHLVIGNLAARVALDEQLDLTRFKRSAAAFAVENFVDIQVGHSARL